MALNTDTPNSEWQPRIVAFLCNWCSYTGADLAGISRIPWSPAVRIVRVMCSGRMDPTFVVKAFRLGADAVIVSGCHPGDCHYQKGNYKALRRVHLLKRLLADFGIEPERLRLVWVSASEGAEWAKIANEMERTVYHLGPLKLAGVPPDAGAVQARGEASLARVDDEAPLDRPVTADPRRGEACLAQPAETMEGATS